MRFSLDIETACGVKECPNFNSGCDHALDPYKSKITVIGLYWEDETGPQRLVLRSAEELKKFYQEVRIMDKIEFTGANLKFDLRTLSVHGCEIKSEHWADDVNLMATCYTRKVSEDYLEWYRRTRKELNEHLPAGKRHRVGNPTSLKVLAPYFLEVEPFW